MAQFFGIKIPPLFRASPNDQRSSLSRPESWLTALFAPMAKSGARVNAESVISLPAVWRAINLISGTLAGLPFEVVEESEDGGIRIAKNHDIYHLLRYEPSPLYTSFIFIRSLIAQACLYGNSYAIIKMDKELGRPKSFSIVAQEKTPVNIFVGLGADNEDVLYYKIGEKTYNSREIIHIQNLSFTGFSGARIIETHRDNFGIALAARDFGNEFYKNGTFLSGYLRFQKSLNLAARKSNAEAWQQAYGGSTGIGRVAVLDEGAEFHPLNMKPSDASMIETQSFSISDISRITGVPPHMLYSLDRATDNNVERMNREYYDFTVSPWATQLEQEFTRKVFRENEKRYTRARRSIFRCMFDMTDLLRADAEARAKLYQSGIQNGWLQPNEARRREGLNPVDGGDKNFMQLNMTTIDKVGQQEFALPESNNQPNGNESGEEAE